MTLVRVVQGSGIRELISLYVPMAPACNPSYSGGRDGESHGLKPARSNSS
jgi:hypothetical protein